MGYKKLKVYQKSYKLAVSIYRYVTESMPKSEQYELSSQMRRASTSIPLNIAEGYGKQESRAEFKRYLMMARGSCNEMGVLLDICRDVGYMCEEHHSKYSVRYEEVSKMLSGLLKS